MAKDFVPLRKKISELSSDEIKVWIGNESYAVVMRSMLVAEVEAIREGDPRERRTMRGLWYDLVKPVLSRAGILNNQTDNGGAVPWDRYLSDYLGELVRDGYTSYEELKIVDGSRQRQTAQAFTYPVAEVDMVGAHFPWVILFTEKDTIWGEVQSLASLYGVSAISGGGYPSNACTENTVRAIIRSDAYQEEAPDKLIILALTDYDPHGYGIAETQHTQIAEAVNGMDDYETGGLESVELVRLGLEPNQLTSAERVANSYEPKKSGLEKWFEKTGGVDGQPLGLELDALPLSRLRRMFANGIEQVIDLEKRREDLREAYINLIAYNLLMPAIEDKRDEMIKAARLSDCWHLIREKELPADLFKVFAATGDGWIGPAAIIDLFDDHTSDLVKAMRSVDEG